MDRENWQLQCAEMKQRGAYLYNSKIWSDCELLVDHNTIKAHKLILAMSSPVFAKMLYGGDLKSPVPIYDVRVEVFHTLLEYIYSDNLNLNCSKDACDLYYAAKKLRLSYVVKECVRYLNEQMSPNNVCEIYSIAWETGDVPLQKACEKIFSRRTKEVIKDISFYDLSMNMVSNLFSLEPLNIDNELDLFNAAVEFARQYEIKEVQREHKEEYRRMRKERAERKEVGTEQTEDESEAQTECRIPPKKAKFSDAFENTELQKAVNTDVEDTSSNDSSHGSSSYCGPALFGHRIRDQKQKLEFRELITPIRFLTLSPQEFAGCGTLFRLLSNSEILHISMNIASRETIYAMPAGLSQSMMPRTMASKEERTKLSGVFRAMIPNFTRIKKYESPPFYLRNMAWSLMILLYNDSEEYKDYVILAVMGYLETTCMEQEIWMKKTKIKLKFCTHKPPVPRFLSKIALKFNELSTDYVSWTIKMHRSHLLNPEHGFIDDFNSVTYKLYIDTAPQDDSPQPGWVNSNLTSVTEASPSNIILKVSKSSVVTTTPSTLPPTATTPPVTQKLTQTPTRTSTSLVASSRESNSVSTPKMPTTSKLIPPTTTGLKAPAPLAQTMSAKDKVSKSPAVTTTPSTSPLTVPTPPVTQKWTPTPTTTSTPLVASSRESNSVTTPKMSPPTTGLKAPATLAQTMSAKDIVQNTANAASRPSTLLPTVTKSSVSQNSTVTPTTMTASTLSRDSTRMSNSTTTPKMTSLASKLTPSTTSAIKALAMLPQTMSTKHSKPAINTNPSSRPSPTPSLPSCLSSSSLTTKTLPTVTSTITNSTPKPSLPRTALSTSASALAPSKSASVTAVTPNLQLKPLTNNSTALNNPLPYGYNPNVSIPSQTKSSSVLSPSIIVNSDIEEALTKQSQPVTSALTKRTSDMTDKPTGPQKPSLASSLEGPLDLFSNVPSLSVSKDTAATVARDLSSTIVDSHSSTLKSLTAPTGSNYIEHTNPCYQNTSAIQPAKSRAHYFSTSPSKIEKPLSPFSELKSLIASLKVPQHSITKKSSKDSLLTREEDSVNILSKEIIATEALKLPITKYPADIELVDMTLTVRDPSPNFLRADPYGLKENFIGTTLPTSELSKDINAVDMTVTVRYDSPDLFEAEPCCSTNNLNATKSVKTFQEDITTAHPIWFPKSTAMISLQPLHAVTRPWPTRITVSNTDSVASTKSPSLVTSTMVNGKSSSSLNAISEKDSKISKTSANLHSNLSYKIVDLMMMDTDNCAMIYQPQSLRQIALATLNHLILEDTTIKVKLSEEYRNSTVPLKIPEILTDFCSDNIRFLDEFDCDLDSVLKSDTFEIDPFFQPPTLMEKALSVLGPLIENDFKETMHLDKKTLKDNTDCVLSKLKHPQPLKPVVLTTSITVNSDIKEALTKQSQPVTSALSKRTSDMTDKPTGPQKPSLASSLQGALDLFSNVPSSSVPGDTAAILARDLSSTIVDSHSPTPKSLTLPTGSNYIEHTNPCNQNTSAIQPAKSRARYFSSSPSKIEKPLSPFSELKSLIASLKVPEHSISKKSSKDSLLTREEDSVNIPSKEFIATEASKLPITEYPADIKLVDMTLIVRDPSLNFLRAYPYVLKENVNGATLPTSELSKDINAVGMTATVRDDSPDLFEAEPCCSTNNLNATKSVKEDITIAHPVWFPKSTAMVSLQPLHAVTRPWPTRTTISNTDSVASTKSPSLVTSAMVNGKSSSSLNAISENDSKISKTSANLHSNLGNKIVDLVNTELMETDNCAMIYQPQSLRQIALATLDHLILEDTTIKVDIFEEYRNSTVPLKIPEILTDFCSDSIQFLDELDCDLKSDTFEIDPFFQPPTLMEKALSVLGPRIENDFEETMNLDNKTLKDNTDCVSSKLKHPLPLKQVAFTCVVSLIFNFDYN